MWERLRGKQPGEPLYRRIMEQIERAVESGLLGRGQRLPAERRLGELFGVHRSTVIRALDELAERGLLLRRQGSGTYVNPEKWGLQNYPILNWQPPAELREIQGSGTWQALVRRYRKEAEQRGLAWRDLSGGDLPAELLPTEFPLPAGFLARDWQRLPHQELDAESSLIGLAALRETVAAHLRRTHGLTTGPEEILITSGVGQALFLITQSLLRPGDAVGIEAPSYFYSLPVFQAAGLRLYAIPTDEEGIDAKALAALDAARNLKMIFLNPIFQNPTGLVMSARRKREVLAYCSLRHIPLVEDDSYSLLGFSGPPLKNPNDDVSPLKKLDAHGQVIYLGSLSSYAGKHLRAGWLVAPAATVNRLARVRGMVDSGLSALPQLLAAHYLEAIYPEHILSLRAILRSRAEALQDRLRACLDARFCKFNGRSAQGGFYLYLEEPGSKVKTTPSGRAPEAGPVLESLLRAGLEPAPGADFGAPGAGYRLNFAQFKS